MNAQPKTLFDVSVLVDALNNEDTTAPESLAALSLAANGRINGYVCAAAIDGLNDMLTRAHGVYGARAKLQELRAKLDIAPVNAAIIDAAVALGWDYLDDALAHECARANGLDRLVTLNPTDFPKVALMVQAPGDLLKEVASEAA